jgi:hypothetical protein
MIPYDLVCDFGTVWMSKLRTTVGTIINYKLQKSVTLDKIAKSLNLNTYETAMKSDKKNVEVVGHEPVK